MMATSIQANKTTVIALSKGDRLSIAGEGAWSYYAFDSAGLQLDSGSYSDPDVIGPFSEAGTVNITPAAGAGLSYETLPLVVATAGLDAQGRLVGPSGVVFDVDKYNKRAARQVFITDPEFGAFDGAADIISAIDAAMLAAGEGGVVHIPATPSGVWYYSRAIIPKDGVTLIVHGNTRMVCTGAGTSNKWPLYSSFILGTGSYYGAPQETHLISDVVETNNRVTLINSVDYGKYFQGDVVRVESVSEYGIMDYQIPTFGQYNVVVSVNSLTGEIVLRHPISDLISGARIRNMSRPGRNMSASPNVDTGIPASALRDFKLVGGIWETTSIYGPFAGSSCMIDSSIDIIGTVTRSPVGYGNSYANCKLKSQWADVRGNGIELALCSHNTEVEIGNINLVGQFANVGWLAAVNESSRDCTVNVGSIGVSPGFTIDSIAQVSGAKRSNINIGTIHGKATVNDVVVIKSINHSGVVDDTSGNEVNIGVSNVSGQARHAYISGEKCKKNKISGKFYGELTHANNLSCYVDNSADGNILENFTAYSGKYGSNSNTKNTRLKSCFFNDGLTDDVNSDFLLKSRTIFENLSTASVEKGRQVSRTFTPVTANQATPYSKSVVIPAGAASVGAIVEFWVYFESTGSAGTKTISAAFAGTNLPSLTVPTGNTDGCYRGRIYASSASVVIYTVETFITGSQPGLVVSPISGLSLASTDYTLTLSGTVASAGDTLSCRPAGVEYKSVY